MTNEGEKPARALFWYVDGQAVPQIASNTGYFHAQYRQEHPARIGRNYQIADIEGKGQYVGTLLSVRQRTPQQLAAGKHQLALHVTGHNRQVLGLSLGFDCLLLVKRK